MSPLTRRKVGRVLQQNFGWETVASYRGWIIAYQPMQLRAYKEMSYERPINWGTSLASIKKTIDRREAGNRSQVVTQRTGSEETKP